VLTPTIFFGHGSPLMTLGRNRWTAAWAKMGDHVLALRSDTNPVDVAAYATKKSDGSLQVLVIDKTGSEHEVTLGFEGYDPKGKSMAVHTGAPAGDGGDSATSVVFNGATNPAPTGSTVKRILSRYR